MIGAEDGIVTETSNSLEDVDLAADGPAVRVVVDEPVAGEESEAQRRARGFGEARRARALGRSVATTHAGHSPGSSAGRRMRASNLP